MFNVNTETCDVRDLQNRTNNALERYNCHLNEIFPKAHPDLPAFVTVLKEESNRVVMKLDQIRNGKIPLPAYQEVNLLDIPSDYFAFDEDQSDYFTVAI
eukprot:6018151-Ditylum_brightwellii.AAC.1